MCICPMQAVVRACGETSEHLQSARSGPVLKKLLIAATVLVVGGYCFYEYVWKYDDTIPVPKTVKAEKAMRVLLVGCTQYPYLDEQWALEGPANDAELMHVTFRKYLGVPAENITTLAGWPDDKSLRPTKANILGQLTRLAQVVQPDDRVVFHYSGHGSQQSDTDEDRDELDDWDEILLAADARGYEGGQGVVENAIVDDELWRHLRAIRDAQPGVTVWLSLDCCHSGGATRGDGRSRGIEPAELGATPDPTVRLPELPAPQPEDMRNIVTTTAAEAHQQAQEFPLPFDSRVRGQRWHGLYTYVLARVLQMHGSDLQFRELHSRLLFEYRALSYDDALPTIEGAKHLRVAPHGKGVSRHLLQYADGKLLLDAGALHGLVAGSVLEVFRPGAGDEAEQGLGKIKIETARLADADCVSDEDEPFDPSAVSHWPLPAVVRQVAVGDVTLPLAVVDASGALIDASRIPEPVRSALDDNDGVVRGRFPLATLETARWILTAGDASYSLVRSGDPLESPKLSFAPDELHRYLFAIYRAHCLRRLARPGVLEALPQGLEIDVYYADSKQAYEKGHRSKLEPNMRLSPGMAFGMDITNRTFEDVDVTVLYVDAGHGITVLHPEADRGHPTPRFTKEERKQTRALAPIRLNDSSVGAESLLVLAVPGAAGVEPIDFTFLAQDTLTRGSGGSGYLFELLTWNQTRAGTTPAPRSLRLGDFPWRARWGPLQIPSALRQRSTPIPKAARTAPNPESPWFVGTDVTSVTGDRGHADAIATWIDDDVQQIYVDAQGDGEYDADPAVLARKIANGTLEADLVVRVVKGRRENRWRPRRTAWYARPDAGIQFPLRLIDEVGDPRADVRWSWDGAWESSDASEPWLKTGNLTGLDRNQRKAVIRRLRAFCR